MVVTVVLCDKMLTSHNTRVPAKDDTPSEDLAPDTAAARRQSLSVRRASVAMSLQVPGPRVPASADWSEANFHTPLPYKTPAPAATGEQGPGFSNIPIQRS